MRFRNLFWDTCIFTRFLIGDPAEQFTLDIERYIEDARRGERTIFFSTLTYAEIDPRHLKTGFGSMRDFFEDLGTNFVPIDPNPNILIKTGELRAVSSTNPGMPSGKPRIIATPDAIMLVTCLFARDHLGISDIILHSTDEGRGKSWAGRTVPIIGFERWYPESTRTPLVEEICSLRRELPSHPEPRIAFSAR